MSEAWMVRSGRASEFIEEFLEHGRVALGDPEIGALSPTTAKDEIIRRYREHLPKKKDGTVVSSAGQLRRFLVEIKNGDSVVTFDRAKRLYYLGTITSPYEWRSDLIEQMPHTRRVTWEYQIPRDHVTVASRNTLGAIQALFKLPEEVLKDLRRSQAPIGIAGPSTAPTETEEEAKDERADEDVLRAEIIEKADEFIEDAVSTLDWQDLQELVAGILRAMGYRTRVSSPGADRGVDIVASPDGLGLQEPRIFVEVKHRPQTPIGSKEVRAFLGGRQPSDRCLYVSTGGFTKDGLYEAERASVPTTLIALPLLRQLLVDHYEKLDAEARALVPLTKLYWPVKK